MNDTATTSRRVPSSSTRGTLRVEHTPPDTDGPGRCDPVGTAGPVVAVDDEQLAAMAKALGHPLRIRIMRLLLERQACMTGDLVAELPVAQSTVSEHLRILREAGLVQGEIEGPRTSYCVNRGGLAAFTQAVSSL